MADKMTRADFAAKIKAKYPAYSEMDDNELVDKILTKYPAYKEQIQEDAPVKEEPKPFMFEGIDPETGEKVTVDISQKEETRPPGFTKEQEEQGREIKETLKHSKDAEDVKRNVGIAVEETERPTEEGTERGESGDFKTYEDYAANIFDKAFSKDSTIRDEVIPQIEKKVFESPEAQAIAKDPKLTVEEKQDKLSKMFNDALSKDRRFEVIANQYLNAVSGASDELRYEINRGWVGDVAESAVGRFIQADHFYRGVRKFGLQARIEMEQYGVVADAEGIEGYENVINNIKQRAEDENRELTDDESKMISEYQTEIKELQEELKEDIMDVRDFERLQASFPQVKLTDGVNLGEAIETAVEQAPRFVLDYFTLGGFSGSQTLANSLWNQAGRIAERKFGPDYTQQQLAEVIQSGEVDKGVAVASALTTAALERLPLGKFGRALKGVNPKNVARAIKNPINYSVVRGELKNFAKKRLTADGIAGTGKEMLKEGITEFAQYFTEETWDAYGSNTNAEFVADEAYENFLAGAVSMGGTHVGGKIRSQLREEKFAALEKLGILGKTRALREFNNVGRGIYNAIKNGELSEEQGIKMLNEVKARYTALKQIPDNIPAEKVPQAISLVTEYNRLQDRIKNGNDVLVEKLKLKQENVANRLRDLAGIPRPEDKSSPGSTKTETKTKSKTDGKKEGVQKDTQTKTKQPISKKAEEVTADEIAANIEENYEIEDDGSGINYRTKDGTTTEVFGTNLNKAQKPKDEGTPTPGVGPAKGMNFTGGRKQVDLSKSKNKTTKQIGQKYGKDVVFMEDPNLPDNVAGRFSIITKKDGTRVPAVLFSPSSMKNGQVDEIAAHETIGHLAGLAAKAGDSKTYAKLEADILNSSYAQAAIDRIGDSIKQGTDKYNNEVFADAVGRILAEESNSPLARRIMNMISDFFKSVVGDKDAKVRQQVRKFYKQQLKEDVNTEKIISARDAIQGEVNVTKEDKIKALEDAGLMELHERLYEVHGKNLEKYLRSKKAGVKKNLKDPKKEGTWVESKEPWLEPSNLKALYVRAERDTKFSELSGLEMMEDIYKKLVAAETLGVETLRKLSIEQLGNSIAQVLHNMKGYDSSGSLPTLIASLGKSITPDKNFETEEEAIAHNEEAADAAGKIVQQLMDMDIIRVQGRSVQEEADKQATTFTLHNKDFVDKLKETYAKADKITPMEKLPIIGKIIGPARYAWNTISTRGRQLNKKDNPVAWEVLEKFNGVKKEVHSEALEVLEASFKGSALEADDDGTLDTALKNGREIHDEYQDNGGFFTSAHNYDGRGRIYDMNTKFSVQSNKIAKGLHYFHEQDNLTNEGYDNILLQIGDTEGVFRADKRMDRIEQAEENQEKYLAIADAIAADPANAADLYTYVHELKDGKLVMVKDSNGNPVKVDEPVIFLASLLEMRRIEAELDAMPKADLSKVKSGLPIHSDATTSQGQQMSALAKDEEAMRLVNLLNDPERHDFYNRVFNTAFEGFTTDPNADGETTTYVPYKKVEEGSPEYKNLVEVSKALRKFQDDGNSWIAEYKKFNKGKKKIDKKVPDTIPMKKIEAELKKYYKAKGEFDQAKYDKMTPLKKMGWYATAARYNWAQNEENSKKLDKAKLAYWGRPEVIAAGRKLMKGPSMTQWYGAGVKTIIKAIMKANKSNKTYNNPETGIFMDYYFVNEFAYRSMAANRKVFPGPAKLSQILRSLAYQVNKQDRNLTFNTKVNDFPFEQEYLEKKIHVINLTHPSGDPLQAKITVGNTGKRKIDKTATATAANVIHSWDSQIPAYIALKANFDTLAIHDNFLASPNNANQMNQLARESMIELYQGNALETFLEQALAPDGNLSEEDRKWIDDQLSKLEMNGVSYQNRPNLINQVMQNDYAYGAGVVNPALDAERGKNSEEKSEDFQRTSFAEETEENLKACKI